MGSNYPLRGGKDTLWEGGVRGAAFVYSDRIQNKGRVCKELIDVSDWVPTLFAQAGGDSNKLSKVDGTLTSYIICKQCQILHIS